MADLVISDAELAQRLKEIAATEHRSVEAVLRSMLVSYEAQTAKHDPLEAFNDVFSGKPLNTAKMVKESSENHFRKKYGDSD